MNRQTKKIKLDVRKVSDFTENTSATSEECVGLSQELHEQVDKVNNIIAKFKVQGKILVSRYIKYVSLGEDENVIQITSDNTNGGVNR